MNNFKITRSDGRKPDEIRPIKIIPDFIPVCDGSVLFECGNTRVISTVSIMEGVPPFLEGTNSGWITAEYSMLPGSTKPRTQRESASGRQSGRTMEIQRLIGRALRAVVDLEKLGPYTMRLDCDVIQADGGTRTASINAAFFALCKAIKDNTSGLISSSFLIKDFLGAISVGMVNGCPFLDLTYEEDSQAEIDMNVVMTEKGKIIEVQMTAEKKPASMALFDKLLKLAKKGIKEIIAKQREKLADLGF